MNDFEKTHKNIDVQLVSGPYASVQDQTFTNAAAGTLSDVVGPRRRLGQRPAEAGRPREPHRPDEVEQLRRLPAGRAGQGGRVDLHDPGRQLRLPAVRQHRPAQEGRGRLRADDPDRVQDRGGQDHRARRPDEGLGHPALDAEPERHPERPHVVGMGLRRQHAEERSAGRHERAGQVGHRVREEPLRRQRHHPRRLDAAGDRQGHRVHERPRRHDDRLAVAHRHDQAGPHRTCTSPSRPSPRSTGTRASPASPTRHGASASRTAPRTRRRPSSSSST